MLERDLVLPHLLAKRAREEPDRVFFQQVDGPELTYRELFEGILLWADAFRRLGVQPFENVAVMMPTNVEAYYAWMGLAWLRAVEVPMNTMFRGRMLQYIVDNADARVLVIGREFADRLAEVAADLPKLEKVIVPDADHVKLDLPFEVVSRSAFLGGATPATDLDGPEYYDIASIIYTSGTTGPSKGVLVPWPELYWFDVYETGEMGEDAASYMFLPPYHVSGKLSLYLTAKHNMRLVMRAGFSLGEFWNDIRKYECTNVGLLGPLARLLMLNPEASDDSDNPITRASCGPLFPEVDDFKKRFGLELGTGYGMTEIGAVTATEGTNIEDWRSCGKARPGRPGYKLRVVDSHDEEVGPGVVGELIVRCEEPWCMNVGYYGMPEKTAEAWRNGWFHTGDGFKYDEKGNFFFVDRLKDAIRRRGENISSFEVEGYVNDHPDVAESAAIGVPSELGEDEVKVCVVRKPESALTAEELIEYLFPKMPRFMVPRYVEFVDAFPKTEATSRTQKVKLRDNALNESTWDREKAGIKLPK
ncbi:MAG: AMP-binding protein [Actinomycetota bacterium]